MFYQRNFIDKWKNRMQEQNKIIKKQIEKSQFGYNLSITFSLKGAQIPDSILKI